MLKFRKSEINDIDAIEQIAEDAKDLLKGKGINQWQKLNYPDRAKFLQDMKDGIGYVVEADGQVAAVCAVTFTPELSYTNLTDGKWLTEEGATYATIHRSAVAKEWQGQHISTYLFDAVAELTRAQGIRSMRVDTHPENLTMQGALKRAGFECCCEMILAEGAEIGDVRLGYERILK